MKRSQRSSSPSSSTRAAALSDIGVSGMTVTEVKGFGRQRGHTSCTAAPNTCRLRPKTRIEVAVRGDLVDQVVEAIIKGRQTGKVGDGKIFITDTRCAALTCR